MKTFTDVYNDTVKVRSIAGEVWVDVSCDVLDFTPDEALKLAAAIRDAAVLAKEQA